MRESTGVVKISIKRWRVVQCQQQLDKKKELHGRIHFAGVLRRHWPIRQFELAPAGIWFISSVSPDLERINK